MFNWLRAEKLQWALTLGNTMKDVIDFLGKTHASLPEEIKNKVPRLFGIGFNDEQIVNGIIRSLKKKDANNEETKEFDLEKQGAIFYFLDNRCKGYERNRFINVVAGMEVVEAKPGEEERKWHPTSGQMIFEKIKKPVPGSDRRREFLDAFGTALLKYDDLDKAYNECVGGRMIIPDPMHQKILRSFSEGTGWFKNSVLKPLKVSDLSGLEEAFSENSSYWVEKGASEKAKYEAKVAARKAKKQRK
ncbi:MAG: hypothetical protein WC906_03280 [Parcubacteria group bacterium]|jgi:hypothetical protein